MPPRLEALVQSLSDKIERSRRARGDNPAAGHLEDRIVKLVERLDASDSRLGHLEAIERGLGDLLVQIDEMRANKQADALRAEAESAVGVDSLEARSRPHAERARERQRHARAPSSTGSPESKATSATKAAAARPRPSRSN